MVRGHQQLRKRFPKVLLEEQVTLGVFLSIACAWKGDDYFYLRYVYSL